MVSIDAGTLRDAGASQDYIMSMARWTIYVMLLSVKIDNSCEHGREGQLMLLWKSLGVRRGVGAESWTLNDVVESQLRSLNDVGVRVVRSWRSELAWDHVGNRPVA